MSSFLKKLLVLFLPLSLVSANDWSLQVNWPESPTGVVLDTESQIAELVQYIFEWSILIGAVLTFGILIYASFRYIVSSGDPHKLSKAKGMLASSFLGLFLLLSSWLLISILNPELSVISDVGVSVPTDIEFDEWEEGIKEEDMCDYGIVSYTVRGEEEKGKTLIMEGQVKHIQLDVDSSIACREGRTEDLKEDIVMDNGEEKIRFIEARKLPGTQRPFCDVGCAEDSSQECDPEFFMDYDPNMNKYCFDLRETGSVKFLSQKPDSIGASCLAGDERLEDGGGCVLNLYKTAHAGRCGQKITDSPPTKGDFTGTYDKKIDCIEIVRYPPPEKERLPN